MNEDQATRIERLQDRVRQEHSNHEDILATMPDDPVVRTAALATILGINALKAMDASFPLEALIAERDDQRTSLRTDTAMFKEQGIPLATDTEEP